MEPAWTVTTGTSVGVQLTTMASTVNTNVSLSNYTSQIAESRRADGRYWSDGWQTFFHRLATLGTAAGDGPSSGRRWRPRRQYICVIPGLVHMSSPCPYRTYMQTDSVWVPYGQPLWGLYGSYMDAIGGLPPLGHHWATIGPTVTHSICCYDVVGTL